MHQGYFVLAATAFISTGILCAALGRDEEAVLASADLEDVERQLIRDRDWRTIMNGHGGNIYMIMKIGAVTGHGLYQIGAHQRDETYEEFLATRNAAGAK